ncbi:hypothetical protein QYE76_045440 [Lolium multiflorum]|uniref:Mutator-like transposase n=2 Tax=Lolium multiflorum TaxID=4521 RepID=A0AAD8TMX5_LOLMU|nr:hypothetical protein QYE76_045440 [Lolium multiflorum]
MGADLSEFQYEDLHLTNPKTWRVSQLKEWLTVNFGLNPEAYTVGVHALWSSSSTEIFWRLKPIERTSQWVHWLEACERRGTHPIALMLPEAKVVNSQEGGGEFHPGQSSQSSDAGGSSFQSGQSSHAAGGHDGSVELESEDEEEDQMQNMMDEEDEDGVDYELDSDESGGSDTSDDNDEEDPIPSSWNHDLSDAMVVDDRHDSAWEYSMNTISVGARYADKRHLQEAITQWAMNTQRVFRTTVSSQKFLTVVCSDARCPARVHGYCPKYDTTWVVSDCVPHNCVLKSMLKDHRNLTSTLLARLFYKEIVENTAMGVKAIQRRVHLQYNYEIEYGKAWRAKQTALENRFGTFFDAYDGVVRLLQTLKDRNPGTHVDIQDFVIPEFPNVRVLHRVFFAFSICIEAFMHCRPVMCVDGTFLTGRYKGQILTAIGVDGNNRIVPLAFAFVESENTASWLWFFRQLKKSIVKDRPNVCVLHDRHAGILAAIKTLKEAGPDEETPWQDMQSRWCMRHLGANFFSQFRNKGLMNLFKKLCKQNQECKYMFLRGKLDEFTKDHVRQRLAARAALAAAHAAAVAQDMAGRPLLDPGIDQKHRASHLEADPQSMDPLQTRTPKKNWMIHPQWEDRLKWAGLLPFARLVEARDNVSRLNYDAALITCLVDRWRPETHTFHFRWGEMAPTLEDVSMLLGLPLAGEPIGPLEEPVGWMHSMDARFLGVREGVGPISFEAHGPRQAWLHEFQIEQFGYPDVPMTAVQITRSLEAYLMWLLGKTMFTDNHGNTISARYIPIAQEIADATEAEHITQRSWGSAVLAATYRGMCKGCQLTSHGSGIVGCPLLLQLWSWTRFPIGRPEIGGGSWPPDELYDADRIDMPTFGSIWTSRKRHFGHNQLRNCYPAFTEQFDLLLESDVSWEPYSEDHRDEAYPGGISLMCTRDWAYWMTKAKIIFDIFVEEMSQQRVMRQFGMRQLIEPPPHTVPLPPRVHAYNRKGANKTAVGWVQLLGPYLGAWDNAPDVSWATREPFDLQEFQQYLRAYMPRTRLRLSQACDPVEMAPSTQWDTYPRHSTSGTRHHAVLTAELQDEAAQYERSLSVGPLLGRYEHHVSFAQRFQEKLRRIYASITCTRSSDVVEYRAAQRPPRPSLQMHQPRHGPRPRMEVPPSPRPPSPNQAGGSGWQNQQQQEPTYEYWQRGGFGMEQQTPMPNLGWRPRMDQPQGDTHMSSMSGSRSFWSSAHDQEEETQQTYQDWMSSQHQTPPPDPTQPTQYSQHEQGYMLPPRQRQPPIRGYSPSPFQAGPPPPRRRGRGRGQ